MPQMADYGSFKGACSEAYERLRAEQRLKLEHC
jgi:hypothetical protein